VTISGIEQDIIKWKMELPTAVTPACAFFMVPTLLLTKKSTTFPGLSRTSTRNFPGPFRCPRMLKYNEKPSPLLLIPVLPPLPSLGSRTL